MTEDKYRQHNMWTCPAKERRPAYADIKITPELIAELDKVTLRTREEMEEATKAFDVPLAPGTLDIIIRAHA